MKAGFLFSNRTAAHHILSESEAHRRSQKPWSRIMATLVAALASVFRR